MKVEVDPANAVEIEAGREAVCRVREYTAELRDSYASHLPLGEKTGVYFSRMLDILVNDPDRIEANAGLSTNFYQFNDLNKVPADQESDAKISISVRRAEQRIADLISQDTWPLVESETRDLVYRWLTWHELGHGVQSAFANVAPRKHYGGSFSSPSSLSESTFTELVMYPSPPEGKEHSDIGTVTIESERFAEGFSRMIMSEWLTERYGTDLSNELLKLMHQHRVDKAEDAQDLYGTYLTSGAVDSPHSYMRNANPKLSINHIGYASPHSPDIVMDILSATNRWENGL